MISPLERKWCIYVAGRFTSSEEDPDARRYEEDLNRRVATEYGRKLFRAGWNVIVPHLTLDVLPIDSEEEGFGNWQDFMAQDLYLIEHCAHALLMMEGWQDSDGARIEYGFAKHSGRMVFFSVDEAINWLYSVEQKQVAHEKETASHLHCPHLVVCPNLNEHQDQSQGWFVQEITMGMGRNSLRGNPVDDEVWGHLLKDEATRVIVTFLHCPDCSEKQKLAEKKKGGK